MANLVGAFEDRTEDGDEAVVGISVERKASEVDAVAASEHSVTSMFTGVCCSLLSGELFLLPGLK